MAHEFKKLGDVEIAEAISESANVLIEENGAIKRVPKSAVGGGGGMGVSNMLVTVVPTNTDAGIVMVPSHTYAEVEDALNANADVRLRMLNDNVSEYYWLRRWQVGSYCFFQAMNQTGQSSFTLSTVTLNADNSVTMS